MSHLESLERKLREMSENGNSAPGDEDGGNSLNSSGTDVVSDLKIPRKFLRVLGYDGRTNDMVYCKPLNPHPTEEEEISVDSDSSSTYNSDLRQKCLIYFGGDMQVCEKR